MKRHKNKTSEIKIIGINVNTKAYYKAYCARRGKTMSQDLKQHIEERIKQEKKPMG